MSNETVPAVAKNTDVALRPETDLVVTGEHGGFTEEEAKAGMPDQVKGYIKSYRYFMNDDNGEFVVRDNETDREIFRGDMIDTVIPYYAHGVQRLYLGGKNGKLDKKTWTPEENELLAVRYSDKSFGNFQHVNLGRFLTKDGREFLKSRAYIFVVCPNLESKFEPIACSFGISSMLYKMGKKKLIGSFMEYKEQVSKIQIQQYDDKGKPMFEQDGMPMTEDSNFPPAYVVAQMFHQKDKNADGDGFDRVCFRFKKNKEGKLIMSHKNKQDYLTSSYGFRLWKKIKETHDDVIAFSESGLMVLSAENAAVEVEAKYNDPSNHAPEPFSDENPFL